jgi:hypothetical protein
MASAPPPWGSDLIVLAADSNAQHGVRGLLRRHESLGIRPITYEVFVHAERDPGCLRRSHDFLRTQVSRFNHAIVLFDHEGCGDSRPRTELEADVESMLAASGWDRGRCRAVIVDPEFDAWVWSGSPHVDLVLGWAQRTPKLRPWLEAQGFLSAGQTKPERPKEAMERALQEARRPRSSARYAEIAEKVTLSGCVDPAFEKLKQTLVEWFPRVVSR